MASNKEDPLLSCLPIIIAAKVRFKVPALTAISSGIAEPPNTELLIHLCATIKQISTSMSVVEKIANLSVSIFNMFYITIIKYLI